MNTTGGLTPGPFPAFPSAACTLDPVRAPKLIDSLCMIPMSIAQIWTVFNLICFHLAWRFFLSLIEGKKLINLPTFFIHVAHCAWAIGSCLNQNQRIGISLIAWGLRIFWCFNFHFRNGVHSFSEFLSLNFWLNMQKSKLKSKVVSCQ